jgi:hypothetical protein
MIMENPRMRLKASQLREAERLSTEARIDRLNRIFAEVENRKNPQHGPGPDEEIASDLWELARMRDQYRD